MTFTPPTPPTPPSPAHRPTPPTPPRIDMTPFEKSSADENFSDEEVSDEPVEETDTPAPIETPSIEIPHVTRKVDDPESMARDAVANGEGPLTKRTVDRGDEMQNLPPAQVQDTQSDYDRRQDVLRQFRDEDARQDRPTENFQPQTVTEQPRAFKPTLNYHEGHGGAFWLGTIVFVAVAAFVVVKKFLFTDKPALTKPELFADETERLQAVREKSSPPQKTKPVAKPVTKPVTKPARPKKDDDDKGKHFEIRI